MTTAVAALPEDLGRFGVAPEDSFKTLGSGTNVDWGGFTALDSKPSRARIPVPILRNSQKDGKADEPGAQSYDVTVEHIVTDLTKAQQGAAIAASLGEAVSDVTLPSFSSGANGSVTVSGSTTFDEIIKVPADDGKTYYVPLKTKTGTVGTFAFLLPGGAAANAKPKNANETGGKAYRDKPDGTVTTFEIRRDQSNYTGQVWEKGNGAVPVEPFELIYAPNGLLKIRWLWRAAIWTPTADTTSGLADVSDNNEAYISDVVNVGIQSLGTPAALAGVTLKALKMRCGYSFDPRMGSVGTNGTTISGSPISGWNRRNSGYDTIECTIDDGNWKQWDDLVIAKTAVFFWLDFAPGPFGGTTGSSRFCAFRPQNKIVQASPIKVDGQQCTALVIQTERRASASQKREYISLFGTS